MPPFGYARTGLIAALYADSECRASREHGRAGDDLVVTQDHVLTVDALFRTLAVEATVHHLDFGSESPPRNASQRPAASWMGS